MRRIIDISPGLLAGFFCAFVSLAYPGPAFCQDSASGQGEESASTSQRSPSAEQATTTEPDSSQVNTAPGVGASSEEGGRQATQKSQDQSFTEPWLEEILSPAPDLVDIDVSIAEENNILGRIGETGMGLAGAVSEKGIKIIKKAEKLIDDQHSWFSGELESTAILVDSYFDNENTNIESNQSQVKVGLSVSYEKYSKPKPGTGLDIKLVLPSFERRVHLLISGDPEELTTDAGGSFKNPASILPKAEDVPKSAAIRYFLIAVDRMSLSVDGGVDIKDLEPIVFFSSRYRMDIDLHPNRLRFTQYAKWYTDTGSQLITRFEWDHLLSESWLIRAGTEGKWYEQREGYFYLGRMELYYTLRQNSVFYFNTTFNFETMPENRLTKPEVKALHRRNIWRSWFFLEGALFASWPEERRYTIVPGISIKVELLFGRFAAKKS
ncbi:MAG: hypothetical protein OEZ32_06290 [Nitrospinota bacterium]|nr:hypothetical protein [Nitrospinota bacterium]